MNVCTALETNTETTEVMQPGMRAFDDPAIFAKAAAMFGTALGDHWLDTAIAQRAPMSLGVVTAIRVDHTRPLQWVATQSADRRNRVDQRQQLRDVVDVRAGQDRGERRTVGVGDDVVLGTGSRAIGGVWPSFWPAPTARIDDESTAAREKSIWSAARSFASSSSCKRSQTPAACQSRSRRQHVTPEPHPISAGRSRQRSPVLRTNRMPVSAARFETGRRPGFFSRRGLGGGSNGSISVHNSSSMIGLAISSVSVVPMPEVNSSPRKLTAPRGLFETVSKAVTIRATRHRRRRPTCQLKPRPCHVIGKSNILGLRVVSNAGGKSGDRQIKMAGRRNDDARVFVGTLILLVRRQVIDSSHATNSTVFFRSAHPPGSRQMLRRWSPSPRSR